MAMIIPGTYIEVRAEGLIRPGPISVGNIGIVGTARRGTLGKVYPLSGLGQARDIFGEADALNNKDEPTVKELTLVRALEIAYRSGARNISAVRVADPTAEFAEYELSAGASSLTLRSRAPGKGYNNATFKIVDAGVVNGQQLLNVSFTVDGRIEENWRDVPAVAQDFANVVNGNHPLYDYAVNSTAGGGSGLFQVDLPDGIAAAVAVDKDQEFGTDQLATEGTNGATTNANIYAQGLEALASADVQIVVLAGEGGASMAAALSGHIDTASTDLMKHERIGIIGSVGPRDLSPVARNDDGRLIFVSPGIQVSDNGRPVTLPGTYAAAAVAGRISSLEPHMSPTNKAINESGLQTLFNGNELENGLQKGVLLLEQRNGSIRIVRGLTTAHPTNTAWSQITTRRIVDYARQGTRSAADPFIGKLNNERVRQELKASINSLLANMLDGEMLTHYDLEVSATRDQEIQGIAMVVMVLQPTFSIDFIRVVMYLQ